jgi:GNAT superfamily N-acetyltransferase
VDWYIKTYEPADAASVAQMWNESDEGWPGGFTGGVTFSEERVLQWLSEERYIDIFLVVADKRVVAYCSLYEYGSEPTAAYVALLNCHPNYWKHGFGRELLKRAVARSTELGYKRLDLHTWPGNMRAVPLYKKTGFFWQPETQVHMLNFLPLILPLGRDFFAVADWYTCYKRELIVKEDDIAWQGMKVYPYAFERDGHMLKAVIDRESRGLTAFENDDYSVACLLPTHDLAAGASSPVRWEIVNKTGAPLPVSLLASGENGLVINKKVSLVVSDRTVIEGDVLVERDIVAHSKDDPAHKIVSTLVVGGQLLVLETGIRPRQAIEISAQPTYISLTPGLPQTVHLRLKNNLKEPTRAQVALIAGPGLAVSNAQQTIELAADSSAGMTCTMTATQAGAPTLHAAISAETTAGPVVVKPAALPLAAAGAGKPVAYLRQDELVVENEWMRLVVQYKFAQADLYRKAGSLHLLNQRAALGLPFYPNEFRATRFAVRIEEKDGAVSAILSATSRQHAGVTFERVFTLDSSPVLAISHRLSNTSDKEHHLELRTPHFSRFGETSVALPTAGGTVVDLAPSFPDWYDDEGRKPASLSETWMAMGGDGFALGIIWQTATANEMDPWTRPDLTMPFPILPPFGRCEAPPIYIFAGAGDWRDVRQTWRRLVKPDAPADNPTPRRALSAATTPSPLLVLDGKAETTLRLDSQRSRALSGTVAISAPAGWEIAPAKADVAGLKRGKPCDTPLHIRLARSKGPAAAEAGALVQHELGEERFALPLIALGKRSGVELAESEENGQRLVSIANGWMRAVVAPDFVGSLVALEQGGVNHLYSSFPSARAFSWINPWHGGVSPVLFALDDEDPGPGNPGRMSEGTWTYQLLHPQRGAAIPWAGLRVSSDLQREKLRGLRLEMDYLTVGQSNVLAVVARLVNTGSAPFTGLLMTQAYVQPGGAVDKGILHDLGERHVRRLRDHQWGGASGRWAGVANSETGQCVALAACTGQIIVLDYGMDGAHMYQVRQADLSPHATVEMGSYLVVSPDVAEARLYRWLKHAPTPNTTVARAA